MALLQVNKRFFKNSVLATALLLSIASFVTFTLYTTSRSETLSNLPRSIQIPNSHDTKFVHHNPKFVHHITQNIRSVERKIKINNQNRSSAVLKHKMLLPLKQSEQSFPKNQGQHGEIHKFLSRTPPNYNVHIFYYPWYKNDKVDGKYAHWNHELLPHWSDKTQTRKRQYTPPSDIGANFYPQLGSYSSTDPAVIDAHMKMIRATGTGVLSVSWYPPHFEGDSETPVDDIMMKLFDAAAKYQLKIAFHLEPFKNRNGQTLREVVKYVIDKYGNHSAFYRFSLHGRNLPLFYVYDSYQIKPDQWADTLSQAGKFSIRNTKYDAIFLGLLVEHEHFNHLTESGFDGFYTYFASNGFVYGSSWKNWPLMALEAKKRNLIFVPSIGPGYLDTRIRTWNGKNTKLRLNGQYYKSAFASALAVKPVLLTITSFNEWHEGTQVEPAVPKTITDFRYEDYLPNSPEFYLNLTRSFVEEYRKNMTSFTQNHEHVDI